MKNLLALMAAALLTFAVVGWYLGWYQLRTTPTEQGRTVTIELNNKKIKEDLSKGKAKLKQILDSKAEPAPAPSQTVQEPPLPPTQKPATLPPLDPDMELPAFTAGEDDYQFILPGGYGPPRPSGTNTRPQAPNRPAQPPLPPPPAPGGDYYLPFRP